MNLKSKFDLCSSPDCCSWSITTICLQRLVQGKLISTRMTRIALQPPVLSACSIIMSILFAYSASVQLNDPDWYLWLPFYASASFVDLLYVGFAASRRLRQAASLVLWGGVLLLVKVVVEDYVDGCSGLLSLDMRERVVREKLGSGLVVLSMSLQLKVSSNEGEVEERQSSARLAQSGIVALVAVSIGLTLHFFTNVVEHMKKL
ncbi:uncharacterized protein LOC121981955 [Zingiber officinale]|uniref:uncharacterized protein LOC121981955 n=1 Tax=Zingiber officinale TaxID=94328 RepID=UPI001C4B4DD2|nr:uncharacterized protein LOC121981955 [Zingiber officinale]